MNYIEANSCYLLYCQVLNLITRKSTAKSIKLLTIKAIIKSNKCSAVNHLWHTLCGHQNIRQAKQRDSGAFVEEHIPTAD